MMNYGESVFVILYLPYVIVSGIKLLFRARNGTERLMGASVLILGCGNVFHLMSRVLNDWVPGIDFSAALGEGKQFASVTVSVFYVLMYYIALGYWKRPENKRVTCAMWVLLAVRVILCLFPQNGWQTNVSDLTWRIIRNVPFAAMGVLIVMQYRKESNLPSRLRRAWLFAALSFLFYLPAAVGSGAVPVLGMLMLPQTGCYIVLIALFRGTVLKDEVR